MLCLLKFLIVTFHFLYDFFAELKIFVVVMRKGYVFHVLSSIGMRDFVTLQVLVFVVVVVFHRYLTLIEWT